MVAPPRAIKSVHETSTFDFLVSFHVTDGLNIPSVLVQDVKTKGSMFGVKKCPKPKPEIPGVFFLHLRMGKNEVHHLGWVKQHTLLKFNRGQITMQLHIYDIHPGWIL